MRAVYLADAPYVHTRRWLEHFAGAGWDVHVISFREATIPGVNVHHIEGLERAGKARYLAHAPRIRRLVRELRPDLVHALHLTSYGFLAALCEQHPKVASVWGRDVMAVASSTPFHTFLTRYALSRADHVTATGPRLAEATLRYAPAGKPVTVVPYGIDLDTFKPAKREPTGDVVVVGSVGRLSPEKGLDVLLTAIAQLARSRVNVRLLIAGDGPDRRKLESLSGRLALEDRVEFRGEVEHASVHRVLGEMDIFGMPSIEEGFGVAALEASAMELPVVASDAHGIPDVVRHERTGLLVAPGDPSALADAIERLASDARLRGELGRAGRSFVAERYRWQDNVVQMERLYKYVIASSTS
jgi:glycosyltransferase involved in cell wall biosynthesis